MAFPSGFSNPPGRVAPGSKTATIRGKTTNAKTGSPVKDVRVTLGLSGHGELAGSVAAPGGARAGDSLFALAQAWPLSGPPNGRYRKNKSQTNPSRHGAQ